MEQNIFFGISFPANFQLNTETQRRFAYLLLASSTTTAVEAKGFIDNNNLISKVKLLMDNLQCEISACTNGDIEIDFNSDTLAQKVLEWGNVFSMPNSEEINELCQEFKIKRNDFDISFRRQRASKLNNPMEIQKFLSESVIGQGDAINTMSIVISNYKKRCLGEPISAVYPLFIGPTGTGKGVLCENLAEISNSTLVNINCAAIVPEGIVGTTISKLIRAAYKSNHWSEKYILHFDEVCKLSTRTHSDDDKPTIQNELLRFFDNKKIPFFEGAEHHGTENQFELNPNYIQCIFSGAFQEGLEEIIYNRLKQEFSGNTRLIDVDSIYSYTLPVDLQSYGIIPELSSRLTHITHLNKLNVESIFNIMTQSINSDLKTKLNSLQSIGVNIKIREKAIWMIAEYVFSQKVGARAISSFVNQLFKDIDLNPHYYKNLEITEQYVNYFLIRNKYRTIFNEFQSPKPDLLKIADSFSVSVDFILDNYLIYKQFNQQEELL